MRDEWHDRGQPKATTLQHVEPDYTLDMWTADAAPEQIAAVAHAVASVPRPFALVCQFYAAPPELRRAFSYNGGDEDWLVLCHEDDLLRGWLPSWVEHLDSCQSPRVYDLGGGFVAIVGAHG